MNDYEYKEEITNTRTGSLGSSDAKMIQQIAALKSVPSSANKRLAVCKGLIENDNVTTRVMAYGDFIEQSIYEALHAKDERYESNPMFVSKMYSRPNVRCITHPDVVLQDDENKVLHVYEVKASKLPYKALRYEYKLQLEHHYLLALERAKELGNYGVKIYLVHYNTEGVDIEAPFEFDPERMTVYALRMGRVTYQIAEGMDIIDRFLESFDFYSEDEVILAEMLPEQVRSQFAQVADFLRDIEAKKAQVDAFREKLYQFFSEKGISKVKCDDFSFSIVQPTQVVSFDAKAWLTDYESKHPKLAKALREKYKSVTNKKGYIQIRTSKN